MEMLCLITFFFFPFQNLVALEGTYRAFRISVTAAPSPSFFFLRGGEEEGFGCPFTQTYVLVVHKKSHGWVPFFF